MNILKNRIILEIGDKLSPVIQHGFLRSEENVIPINFKHQKGEWENVCLIIFEDTLVYFMNGRCYAILLHRQMLLPWQMLVPYDIVANVIATEEDVKSSFIVSWQMLLPYDTVVDVKNHLSCMFQQCYLQMEEPL